MATTAGGLIHFYRAPGMSEPHRQALIRKTQSKLLKQVVDIKTEYCFNVQLKQGAQLSAEQKKKLHWLLAETFERELTGEKSYLEADNGTTRRLVEVGPRLNFSTPFSTNAVEICRDSGLDSVARIERSRRYLLVSNGNAISDEEVQNFAATVHDRMTEQIYPQQLQSLVTDAKPTPVRVIPIMEEGRKALEKINEEMGLGFDDWDLDYYTSLFRDKMGRNPTDVECFDMGQSNSEHSRHWFFSGKMVLNGVEQPETLFQMVKSTLPKDKPTNSVIAFHDNSSAIQGFPVKTILPQIPGEPSAFSEKDVVYHPILTAETHNFPSGVAPFPGAETGTGGRIRDVQATGTGAHCIAGISSYCVGNLNIPGYELPWEDKAFTYPNNLAKPLDIEVEASNGASDYGNKFGEPVVTGYTRSFGLRLPSGERREWIKPIMFSAGIGQMDDKHKKKGEPEVGMWVVKVGGPAYRIGMGGGAASSRVQDSKHADLDFNAVQRGDAEMENKMNRVIRACIEMGENNPIVSIHDQGAGGNGNVLKEIVEPMGAKLDVRKVVLGDETLSVLEIWGAEYQENCALLLRPKDAEAFLRICEREQCPVSLLGQVTGDGRVVLVDSKDDSTPVDLDLALVLGKMPQKTFVDKAAASQVIKPLELPNGTTVQTALDRVLRLLSVGSKRFLTTKVDRSVTGLIARQQCSGPLHIPVVDVAVVAQSHFPVAPGHPMTGIASAVGEQPIKGLVDPEAMARLTVGEALTNLIWAKITKLEDVKASGNWMWAAKLPGEGCAMYNCCKAMSSFMRELGISIDGGKDSLSMAAKAGGETVKAPGTLVITTYAPCPDVTQVATPDLKQPGSGEDAGVLIYVDLGGDKHRLGGSALAQVYAQVGDETPDVESPALLKHAFEVTQSLIAQGVVLSGHDRSDGGLVTTLLEMAFSGNCGLSVDIQSTESDPVKVLFSEELGLVLEVLPSSQEKVVAAYKEKNVPVQVIGHARSSPEVRISVNGSVAVNADMRDLRDAWEATSFELDKLQCNPECVVQEQEGLRDRSGPKWALTYTPQETNPELLAASKKPNVAIIRQEGSNGDREMASAFYAAGFNVWDVLVGDLKEKKVSLSQFQGIVFVGGFSYADVLGSGKGWAGAITFNPDVKKEFNDFHARSDTFSLGVCNGCQLMALLGWIPKDAAGSVLPEKSQPRFIENRSGRFESRFSSVKILPSKSLFFQGMEGSSLGIWVAHGEGYAHFPDSSVKERVLKENLAPLRYVDDENRPTERYPLNPNGSPDGIAALCSSDGRHLAMMPHPERCYLLWQWPWMPQDWRRTLKAGPWLKMFQNARKWCDEVNKTQ